MSPSTYSANSHGSPRSSAETVHPGQKSSHEKHNGPPNTTMNSENTSSSTTHALTRTDDEENPVNHKANAASSEQARYAGLIHSMDMMEGSFKYAGLGLTPKTPGSVARGRAIAASRLRNMKPAQSSFQAPYNDTEMPAESAPSTASSETSSVEEEKRASSPIGKWRCCTCHRGHDVYSCSHSQHPVGALDCVCAHRSCSKCTLGGLLKQFVPMSEPEVVPLPDDTSKAVRFGVFCDGCGVAWRAQEVHEDMKKKAAMKSALLRVTAIPKRLNREVSLKKDLRASRSMDNLLVPSFPSAIKTTSKSALNLRALAHEMEKEHGEQADMVCVRFTGIKCSCGMVTDATSLCFQIVDPPRDFYRVQFAKQMAERRVAGFGSTAEDKARGHGTPTLVLRGDRRHPNPLMSSPVS